MITYIIFIIMVVGIVLSIIMCVPYPGKFKRWKLYSQMCERETIIECGCSDWRLWIVRGVALVGMCWAALMVYDFCRQPMDFLKMEGIYLAAFALHFLAYLRLDRKYYFCPRGLWIGQIKEEPIPYEEVEIVRKWLAAAPFSGVRGNCLFVMRVKGKKFRVMLPKEDEEEMEAGKSEQSLIFGWLPQPEKRRWEKGEPWMRLGGAVLLAAGIVMACIFGILACVGLGAGQQMPEVSSQYKQVFMEEQAPYGEITTIYEGKGGRLYALVDDCCSVNVYTKNGRFLFAYKAPLGKKGMVRLAVREPYVYLKNRDDMVYTYKDTEFIERESLADFRKKNNVPFVEEYENLEKAKLLQGSFQRIFGDNAVPWMFLGILLLLCGLTIYNKGREA